MNRIHFLAGCVLLTVFCAVSASIFFNAFERSTITQSLTREDVSKPNGFGSSEDAEARLNYDRRRLADPATGIIPPGIRARELQFARGLPVRNSGTRGLDWTSRGPVNQGGRTRALAFDTRDADVWLAGGVTGGIWRSENRASSFYKVTAPDQLHSVTSIVQDTRPGKEDTWYAGTGEYYAVVSAAAFTNRQSGNGIYKSTDNGMSWDFLPATVSNTPTTLYNRRDFDFVWNVVTDPTDLINDVVLAAVYNGIWYSADGGASWQPGLGLDTAAGSTASAFTDITVTSNGVFYACISASGADKGIWRSEDGLNWTDITPVGFPGNFRRARIAMAPSDENQFYLIAETPTSGLHGHSLWHYTYLTGDGAGSNGSWENRSSNLPTFPCAVFYTFEFGNYNSQSSYDMCIAVKPDDPQTVFLGGTNVYRSTDGFTTSDQTTWVGGYQCDSLQPSNYVWPNHHPDQHLFKFDPDDAQTLITANDGGLYQTSDNLAEEIIWESLNNGYITTQFYTVAIEEGWADNDIIVGGTQDNGTWFTNSADPSRDWKSVFYGDGAYAAIPQNREYYVLSWQTGKVFKHLIDDDGNVTGLTRIDPDGGGGYLFINPFALDPNNSDVFYLCAGRYLWRNDIMAAIPVTGNEYETIDTGWTRINESALGIGFPSPAITAIDPAHNPPGRLYYGTSVGDVYVLDGADTETPVRTKVDVGIPNAYVGSISVDPEDGDHAVLCMTNYGVRSIFQTTDAGGSWNDISGNLEEMSDGTGNGPAVNWVDIYTAGDTTVYFAGTSVGLFSTANPDGMSTVWEQEGASEIGNVVINMIRSRASDGLIAVGTHGSGVYSARLPVISSVDGQLQAQSLEIVPNPVASSGGIVVFELKIPGSIRLELLDADGRICDVLYDGFLAEGSHQLDLEMQKSGPGMYFIAMETASGRLVRRFIRH